MGAWLDLLVQCAGPALWLDDTAYSGRLLAGGRIPWLDVTGLIGWRLKAFALLKPSLVVLDVGALAAAFAAARRARSAPSAAERRPGAPLAALLSAVDLRQHVAEVLRALRQSFRVPLALATPSPRSWPALAYMSAFGERPPIGSDDADDASVQMAAFLRNFGDTGVDVLLLTEDATSPPPTAEEVNCYQSVINVGRHYRWDVGLKTPAVLSAEGRLDFLIAPSGALGVDVGDAFWEAGGALPRVAPRGFLYARIPEEMAPELVLARLGALGRR